MNANATSPQTAGVSLAVICGDAQRQSALRMLRSVFAYPGRLVDEVVFGWNGSGEPPSGLQFRPKGVDLKIVRHTWRRDFAAARNQVLNACSRRWHFWLDCDDVIASPAEAQAALQRNAHAWDASKKPFNWPSLSSFLETRPLSDTTLADCVWLPYDYAPGHPLLFPRIQRLARGWTWTSPIHEEIEPVDGAPYKADTLYGLVVLHRPVETAEVRQDRNVAIMRQLVNDGTATANTYYHLARAVESYGEAAEALDLYDKAINDTAPRALKWHYPAAVHAALCALGADRAADAERYADTCAARRPDLGQSWRLLALCRGMRGAWIGALHAFDAAADADEVRAASPSPPPCFYTDERLVESAPLMLAVRAEALYNADRYGEALASLLRIPKEARDESVRGLMRECRKRA